MTVAAVIGMAKHLHTAEPQADRRVFPLSVFPSEPPVGFTAPLMIRGRIIKGALAQLGERLICIQEVRSSILLGSTNVTSRREVTASESTWRSQVRAR